MAKKEKTKCSFCGHKEEKVIAGPKVYICFDCVELCNEIIDEHEGPEVTEVDLFESTDIVNLAEVARRVFHEEIESYDLLGRVLNDSGVDQKKKKKKKKKSKK